MAKINLSRMDFDALVNLRKRVEEGLLEHRGTIEKQLERLGGALGSTGGGRGKRRGNALKGKKVATL